MKIVGDKFSTVFSNAPTVHIASKPIANNVDVFHAIKTGNVEHVAELSQQYGFDLSAVDNERGGTPLHLAVVSGEAEILGLLLEHTNNKSSALDAVDSDGFTPLMRAAERHDLTMMKALVEAGSWADIRFHEDWPTCNTSYSQNFNQSALLSYGMIKGSGDLSNSFEVAVKNSRGLVLQCLAEGFIKLGADPISLIKKLFDQQSLPTLMRLLSSEAVSGADMLEFFNDVYHSGNTDDREALQSIFYDNGHYKDLIVLNYLEKKDLDVPKLFDLGNSDLIRILKKIDLIQDKGHGEKTELMTRLESVVTLSEPVDTTLLFHNAGVSLLTFMKSSGIELDQRNLDTHLWNAAKDNHKEIIKTLLDIGADGKGKLMNNSLLEDDGKYNIANVMLRSVVFNDSISNRKKLAELDELLKCGPGVEKAAIDIFTEVAKARNYDLVKFFMIAKVPSAEVLINLGKSGDRDIARKLIGMNADLGGAMDTLLRTVDTLIGKDRDDQLMKNPLHQLMLSALKNH